MVAAKAPSPAETMWVYQGADAEIYGPFSGQSMLDWVKSGYFKDNLLIKTGVEDNFHPLGEWSRILGNKLPFFFSNLTTFENALGVPAAPPPPPVNAMQPPFFFPPGLAQPPPFHPPFRHSNGMAPYYPEASIGHPPPPPHADTSMDGSVYCNPEYVEPRPPRSDLTRSVETETERVETRNKECQTLPTSISKEQATRILSELFGQKVQIS